MAATEDGSELVNVRKRWEVEDRDFTPWLADNLHLLGEEICMNLELVQVEKQIDSLYLDVLARDADRGVMVAIENQLEATDLVHLGQLLTYATGCHAHAAVWVAPEFMHRYAKALHRLNEWTTDRIDFYGVKIEVVKEPGGELTPRFRKVVYPGGWNRDITLPTDTLNPRIEQFEDFFQPLIVDLRKAGFTGYPTRRFGTSFRHFPSPLNDGIWYAASLEGTNDAWVTLHIEMGDKKQTKHIFDTLLKQQERIQECLAGEWHWNRHNGQNFSSINIRRDGSIDDCVGKLKETRVWMLCTLPKLKQVFAQRVAKILKELPE